MSGEKHPHIHHRQRIKTQFLSGGLDGFSPHGVLELLLFFPIKRTDTNPAAHALKERFGSVEGVLSASPEQLRQTRGIGEKTAEFLSFIGKAAAFYDREKEDSRDIISTKEEAAELFIKLFSGITAAKAVIYTDKTGGILKVREIFDSKKELAENNFSEIINPALTCGARGFFFAEKRDSPLIRPMKDDVLFVKSLYETAKKISLSYCNHVVIGKEKFVIFSDTGIFPEDTFSFR